MKITFRTTTGEVSVPIYREHLPVNGNVVNVFFSGFSRRFCVLGAEWFIGDYEDECGADCDHVILTIREFGIPPVDTESQCGGQAAGQKDPEQHNDVICALGDDSFRVMEGGR